MFTVSEVDGSVAVCIELLEGRLERDVSVILETETNSGVLIISILLSLQNIHYYLYTV